MSTFLICFKRIFWSVGQLLHFKWIVSSAITAKTCMTKRRVFNALKFCLKDDAVWLPFKKLNLFIRTHELQVCVYVCSFAVSRDHWACFFRFVVLRSSVWLLKFTAEPHYMTREWWINNQRTNEGTNALRKYYTKINKHMALVIYVTHCKHEWILLTKKNFGFVAIERK